MVGVPCTLRCLGEMQPIATQSSDFPSSRDLEIVVVVAKSPILCKEISPQREGRLAVVAAVAVKRSRQLYLCIDNIVIEECL